MFTLLNTVYDMKLMSNYQICDQIAYNGPY